MHRALHIPMAVRLPFLISDMYSLNLRWYIFPSVSVDWDEAADTLISCKLSSTT